MALELGVRKKTILYHFTSKEELLFELAGPLLGDIESVLSHHEHSSTAADPSAFISDYLDALWKHRTATEWIDGDKSVLNHGNLGSRLDATNARFHDLVIGTRATGVDKALASAVLGMLWRPVRNGHLGDDAAARSSVVDLVTTAVAAI